MFKNNRILVLVCMSFMIRWGSTSPSSRYASESETEGRYWPVMDEVLRRTPHSNDAQKSVEDDTSPDEQNQVQVDEDDNVVLVDSDLEDAEVRLGQDAKNHTKHEIGQLPIEDMDTTVEDDNSFETVFEEIDEDRLGHQGPAPCDPKKECNGQGSCRPNGGCRCHKGWTGRDCSIPACDPDTTCNGNGFCAASGGCICKKGFRGDDCSNTVCNATTTCNGRGTCQLDDTCKCNEGFKGTDCLIARCNATTTCNGQGICQPDETCKCNEGFQGKDCSKKVTVNKIKLGGNVKADNLVIHPLVLQVAQQILRSKAAFLRQFVNLDDGNLNADLAFSVGGRSGQIYLNPLMLLPGAGLSAAAGSLVGGPIGAVGGFRAGYTAGFAAGSGQGGLGVGGALSADALRNLLSGIPGILGGSTTPVAQNAQGTDNPRDKIDFDSRVFLTITGPEQQQAQPVQAAAQPVQAATSPLQNILGINIGNMDTADVNKLVIDGNRNLVLTGTNLTDGSDVRVGQSAENQIVVDPRSGQLFLRLVGTAGGNELVIDGNGNLVLVGTNLTDGSEVRVGQSAENGIVVDPRSGQLFLRLPGIDANVNIKVDTEEGKKARIVLDGNGNIVVVGTNITGSTVTRDGTNLVDEDVNIVESEDTEDQILVDPRSGQLFLITAAHNALKAGDRLTRELAPVVLVTSFLGGAGATAIPGATAGGLAGLKAGAVAGALSRLGHMHDIPGADDDLDDHDAVGREEQRNAIVIDGNGNAILVNDVNVDPRSGQTIPAPVLTAALDVARASAHLAPYVVIPLVAVGSALGGAAHFAAKAAAGVAAYEYEKKKKEAESGFGFGSGSGYGSPLLNLIPGLQVDDSGNVTLPNITSPNISGIDINGGFQVNLARSGQQLRVEVDGNGNLVLANSDLEDSTARVQQSAGQNVEDEIVVDPRTGQLLLIKATKKIVHKGKKVLPIGLAAAVGGVAGATAGAIGNVLKTAAGIPRSILNTKTAAGIPLSILNTAAGIPLSILNTTAGIPLSILNNPAGSPVSITLVDVDGDGNLVLADSDLEASTVRVQQSAGQNVEDKVVVDPRTGQLLLLTAAKPAAPSAVQVDVDGNGNLVLANSDLEASTVRVQQSAGQNVEDKVVVDPRTGQLILLTAAKKAVHKGKKVVKTLGPAVAVGGVAGATAGALRNALKPAAGIPLSILNNPAGIPLSILDNLGSSSMRIVKNVQSNGGTNQINVQADARMGTDRTGQSYRARF